MTSAIRSGSRGGNAHGFRLRPPEPAHQAREHGSPGGARKVRDRTLVDSSIGQHRSIGELEPAKDLTRRHIADEPAGAREIEPSDRLANAHKMQPVGELEHTKRASARPHGAGDHEHRAREQR